ncbi:MAG TPA: thymidylate synthase [Candidatus Saccharimonadales bacterium]|nr:thymidylate synthase [Candidatus Saccharimonadales bacterium]
MIITKPEDIIGLALPTIHVVADNIPQAWEESVIATWEMGVEIRTQYDKVGDPPSRDCSLMMTIRDPFAEPRIHRGFPGGLKDLESYRQEVVDGIHDDWVDPNNPITWQYTYHERICNFDVPGLEKPINQLDYIVEALAKETFTRQAQAVLWKPWLDPGEKSPCCLQRMWFRIFNDELVANIHIRSNDAFKAAFMNIYAFTDLQRVIAERVSEKLGRPIKVGQYNHFADSYHIYGSYYDQFVGFLKLIGNRPWEERTWRTDDVQEFIDEARVEIAADLSAEKAKQTS